MNTALTPPHSRYIPLTQQKYCCVPTCIQMVMVKHGIPLIPAEVIGYHMGLVVPENEAHLFWKARTGPRPPSGYGTQASKQEYSPNAMFKKLNIPLAMSWRLIDTFSDLNDFKQYLLDAVQKDKDVLLCYDWGKLFGRDYQGGHVCVLDAVDVESGTLRMIDPESAVPKWREISIEMMFEAMQFHGPEKSGGCWELTFAHS